MNWLRAAPLWVWITGAAGAGLLTGAVALHRYTNARIDAAIATEHVRVRDSVAAVYEDRFRAQAQADAARYQAALVQDSADHARWALTEARLVAERKHAESAQRFADSVLTTGVLATLPDSVRQAIDSLMAALRARTATAAALAAEVDTLRLSRARLLAELAREQQTIGLADSTIRAKDSVIASYQRIKTPRRGFWRTVKSIVVDVALVATGIGIGAIARRHAAGGIYGKQARRAHACTREGIDATRGPCADAAWDWRNDAGRQTRIGSRW